MHCLFGNVLAYKTINFIIGCKDFDRARYVRSMGYDSSREVVEKKIYGKPQKLKFRDTEFCVPAEYDQYLKNFYGDYMIPLPENEREAHYDLDDVYMEK